MELASYPIKTHDRPGVGSGQAIFRSHFRLRRRQASVSTMGSMASSFEQRLIRRMHAELDALSVTVPVVPDYSGHRSFKFVWVVARPLALALAAALLLGSVAVFASGSPNPKVWVTQAARSLGIQAPDDEVAPDATPSPRPSKSPEPAESPSADGASVPAGSRVEPGDKPTTEPVERETPQPAVGAAESDG